MSFRLYRYGIKRIAYVSLWLLALAIILGACGRTNAEVPEPVVSANPASAGDLSEPTDSPLELTATAFPTASNEEIGAAHQTALAGGGFTELGTIQPTLNSTEYPRMAEQQTAFAQGFIPTLESTMAVIPVGILPCSANGTKRYQVGNCWTGLHAGSYMYAHTAVEWANPSQGLLFITTDTDNQHYATPMASGLVIVSNATWPYLTLSAKDSSQPLFIFNVETRQWVDSNGTPLPTTPTATPVGQWVQSLTLFNADTDQQQQSRPLRVRGGRRHAGPDRASPATRLLPT